MKKKIKKIQEWAYVLICNLNQLCDSEQILLFFRVHTFQAALEALLTFYLVQVWIVFSPVFSSQSLSVVVEPDGTITYNNEKFFAFIVFSIVFGVIVYMLYMIFLYIKFTESISESAKKIINMKGINPREKYQVVEESFGRVSLFIHKIGTAAYGLVGLASGFIYIQVQESTYLTMPSWIICIIILLISLTFGALWNYQDYHADKRLDWSMLIIELKYQDNDHKCEVEQKKLFHACIHTFSTLAIMMLVLLLVVLLIVVMSVTENGANNAEPLLNLKTIIIFKPK